MPKRKKVADPREEQDCVSVEQSRISHTEMLNFSFFRWIQDQHANHRSEFWRNGVEEYLQYGREILTRFPVAVDTAAAAAAASAASEDIGTAVPSQSPKQVAFPALSKAPDAFNPATAPSSTSASATPDTSAAENNQAPQPLFGLGAALRPAAFSFGAAPPPAASSFRGHSSTGTDAAPKQTQPFSLGGQSSSIVPSPSGHKEQPAPSLSNHHLLPSNTTHGITAAAGSVTGLPAASGTSVPPPNLSPSTTPATTADQSSSFGPSLPLADSSFNFGPPSTSGTDKLPSTSSSQPPSSGAGPLFAFGGASQAAASSLLPFTIGSGLSAAASSPMSFGSAPPPSFATPHPVFGTSQLPGSGSTIVPDGGITPPASPSASPYPFSFTPSPPVVAGSGPAAPFGSSQPTCGSGHFAFGGNQSAFGSNSPAAESGSPAFGSSQPAFGSSQPAFGSSQPAFGSSQPAFGSSQPAFGSPLPALGPNQPGASDKPLFAFGSSLSPSSAPAGTLPVFSWGQPSKSPLNAAEADRAATAAATNGNGAAFGFGGAVGFGGFGGVPGQSGAAPGATLGNGTQEDEESAEPEEAVTYEQTEGVLLSQEIKWRHMLDNKWDGKPRQGKVLVCQPAGTSKPYLQFQTSGQVVATAHAQAPLKQRPEPGKLMASLAMSIRSVDKDSGAESYADPVVRQTVITCASAAAAKELMLKMTADKS